MANPLSVLFGAVFSVLRFVWTTLTAVFASSSSSDHLTAYLHSSRLLLYRGPATYVPITIIGKEGESIDGQDLEVTLIQKGYRAGLFGWTIARFLGDVGERGLDVTPESSQSWDSISSDAASITSSSSSSSDKKQQGEEEESSTLSTPTLTKRQRTKMRAELDRALPSLPHKQPLGTLLVRVPVRSGDGYFRFKIKRRGGGKKGTVYTPTVRIFSVSLSSASLKGASLLPPTLVPELLLRSVGVAVTTFLYGLFPIAAILEKVLPRMWSRKLLGWLYRRLGMEDRQRAFMDRHGQKVTQAKRRALETVPFASLGVRTSLEIEKDDQAGRGGILYLHV